MTDSCEWLGDRCDRPAAGDAAHEVFGVIKICTHHAAMFRVALIGGTGATA